MKLSLAILLTPKIEAHQINTEQIAKYFHPWNIFDNIFLLP